MAKAIWRPTYVKSEDYEVVQATNNHIAIYEKGRLKVHVQCDDKKDEAELLELLDIWRNIELP